MKQVIIFLRSFRLNKVDLSQILNGEFKQSINQQLQTSNGKLFAFGVMQGFLQGI